MPNWISGKGRYIARNETQNLCPLNQWGQRFVRLNRASDVAAAPRRLPRRYLAFWLPV